MGGEVIVRNGAPVMVVLFLVERIIDTKVLIKIAHVITNNIHHNPDVSSVTGRNEIFEILLGSKVIVQLVKISTPVTMVTSIAIVDDWGDPDCIKAHTLNVVKVVDDTSVATAAVVAQISAVVLLAIISGESISEELINGPSLPLLG